MVLCTLTVAQYVCSLSDFRRLVINGRLQLERVYETVVATCAQMSAGLAYADLHPSLFPSRLFTTADLVPCPSHPSQLYLPFPASNTIGIHTLNKTLNGTAWNATALDDEIQFLRPILHMLPTFLAGNPETSAIYFLGIAMKCATLYSYPARDFCGLTVDGLDLCEFYDNRYNMYSKIANLRADFDQGGHWSEPMQSRGAMVSAYSIPIADSRGNFQVQVQMSVDVLSIREVFEAMQPSENGYTFLVTKQGHIIYAQQPAINLLFGAHSNYTLASITSSYQGLHVLVVGKSLFDSPTNFSKLSEILKTRDDSVLSLVVDSIEYHVTWVQLRRSCKNWFLVSVMPKRELDNSAVWLVAPRFRNVTLSPDNPSANVTFKVMNRGLLPLAFLPEPAPPSAGLRMRIVDGNTWFTVVPGSNQTVVFVVEAMGQAPPIPSRFLMPLTTTGSCFPPLFFDLSVNFVTPVPEESEAYAVITVLVLCCVTLCIVIIDYVMLFRYRRSPTVRAISPQICVFKLFGLVLLLGSSVCTVLPPTMVRCEFARWLFHIGFCLTCSSTIAKNYRLRLIFYSKTLPHSPLSNKQLMVFIASVVSVDVILLTIGTTVEPYIVLPNQCVPSGRVIFALLITTKALLWIAAFVNTISLARIPMRFADSRLNAVLIVVAALGAIYLGLQVRGFVHPRQLLFLGAMFIWVGAFAISCHMILKLRKGYVVRVRKRARSNSVSMTPPAERLKARLEALLDEMELKQVRLINDKLAATENLQSNQRLLFDLRATLFAFDPQEGTGGECSLDEDAVEKHLPQSIREAFDKHEGAVIRRMSVQPNKRNIVERKTAPVESSSFASPEATRANIPRDEEESLLSAVSHKSKDEFDDLRAGTASKQQQQQQQQPLQQQQQQQQLQPLQQPDLTNSPSV